MSPVGLQTKEKTILYDPPRALAPPFMPKFPVNPEVLLLHLSFPSSLFKEASSRPSGGSRRLTKGGERTDHLPICDQTKLYLKNGIQIDRHKSHLYQSTLIDETAT